MFDHRTISEHISNIITKNDNVRIDLSVDDSVIDMFIYDMEFMRNSLSILYNKVDSGEIEDSLHVINLINAVIMDYKLVIYQYRFYDRVCKEIGVIVRDLENLIDIL